MMAFGDRLKLARKKAGMTMRELAEQTGISATAVSKFERSVITPRQSTVLRLAKALGVRPAFFFKEITVKTLTPAYRKHSGLREKETEAIEATVVEKLERYLEVEGLFPERAREKLPQFTVTNICDVENVASVLRKEWNLGIGPLDSLCGRLEDRSIIVIAIEGPAKFDGYSCWANGSRPTIVYNSLLPGDRQRFTLGHELGHLVIRTKNDLLDEQAIANRFSAAFLVPKEAAFAELGSKRKNLNFNELRLLKREYGLSIQAWIRRAFDLGIIEETTYRNLFRRLSTMGWRRSEPEEIKREYPQRFELLIHQALAEELITPNRAKILMEPEGKIELLQPSKEDLQQTALLVAEVYEDDPELTAFSEAAFGEINDEDL